MERMKQVERVSMCSHDVDWSFPLFVMASSLHLHVFQSSVLHWTLSVEILDVLKYFSALQRLRSAHFITIELASFNSFPLLNGLRGRSQCFLSSTATEKPHGRFINSI